MTRLVLFLLLSSVSFSCLSAEKPQRIVSLSLCSDELVLLLSDHTNIVSLSYLSTDPRYSSLITNNSVDFTGIYLNHGLAEEIIPLEPDLILSSQFSAGTAVNLLQGFGYPVTTLGFPSTLNQAYQQIEQVAALIDENERGANLIQQIQNHISAVQDTIIQGREISALFYSNNGFSFGSNTLRDDFLNSIGIKNLAAEYGLMGSGKIPIELLISSQPDFLLVDQAGLHDDKIAQALLQHPALNRYFPAEKIIILPSKLFQCAGPNLIQAYEIMSQALGQQ